MAALRPKLTILACVACLGGAAFAKIGCSPSTRESTFELRDFRRSYAVVARVDHDPKRPAPVVIALHAYATEAGVLESALDLPGVAVRDRGYLLVVPQGTKDSRGAPFWNATRACCDAERRQPDDLGYLRAVLADVRSRYALDPSRIVAIGVSNGGFMAYRWACAPGGDLSAVVSISGVGPGTDDPACAPSRTVSTLHMHGDADEIVRYHGGVMNGAAHPSAGQSVRLFAKHNGCAANPTQDASNVPAIGIVARAMRWACPTSVVELWTTRGGGHQLFLRSRFSARALDLLGEKRVAQGVAR